MIDIGSRSSDPRARPLSNFEPRKFTFEQVKCGGIEGILQALKCAGIAEQCRICALSGIEAKRAGDDYNCWKVTQILWWQRVPYERLSRRYQQLITRIYDAVFDQDPTMKRDLLAIGEEEICHSIGKLDMRDTVLTEVEMLYQLYRLLHRSRKNS